MPKPCPQKVDNSQNTIVANPVVTNTIKSTEITNTEKPKAVPIEPAKPVLQPNYRKSMSWLGIIIPGLPQYQADDPGWGTFYLISGLIGAGLFTYSEIAFGPIVNNYNSANDATDAVNYYNQISTTRVLSYVGLGVWAASAVISFIHASAGPVSTASYNYGTLPVSFALDTKGGYQVVCSWRF